MKKLIDELESLKNEYNPQKYTTDADIIFGIEKAIIAVRAHNPWHEVGELPPMDSDMSTNTSIDVLLTDGVNCVVGYYDFEECKWVSDGYEHTFTHWKYLEELPK